MSYFGVSLRNGVGLGLGTVPSLVNTPLSYRLAPALNLQFAGAQSLDPRITFTRASTATYFNSAGVLTTTGFNLLLYSAQFDNAAWSPTGLSSITANTVLAPDGTTTADTLTEDSANALHRVFQQLTTTAQSYAISCFFKAKTRNWVYLRVADSGGVSRNAFFNLSTGALGTVDTNITATITSVGSGWYRCTAVVNAALAGTNTLSFGMSNADNTITYTGDGTSGIYIWGAQLETGSAATVYIPTTSATSGAARFDYDPVTLAPKGLLIEESRTNLVTYSEQFDNAAWGKVASTVTANAVVSPDGTQDADVLIADATNAEHVCDQSLPVTAGNTYTFSAYVKANGLTDVGLRFIVASLWTGGVSPQVRFNLTNGTASTISGTPSASSIQSVGNGWYRVSMSVACTTSGTSGARIQLMSGVSNVFTGNGTNGITTWGAQMEVGAFATSYIPTVASQVTRAADVAVMTGTNFSSWYNATEGTLLAEYSIPFDSSASIFPAVAAIADGTFSNAIASYERTVDDTRRFLVRTGGVAQVPDISSGGVYVYGTTTKQAAAYKVNDFAFSAGGAAAVVDASGTVPSVDRMGLGGTTVIGGSLSYLNGTIRKIAYYNRRLTNAELQGITS